MLTQPNVTESQWYFVYDVLMDIILNYNTAILDGTINKIIVQNQVLTQNPGFMFKGVWYADNSVTYRDVNMRLHEDLFDDMEDTLHISVDEEFKLHTIYNFISNIILFINNINDLTKILPKILTQKLLSSLDIQTLSYLKQQSPHPQQEIDKFIKVHKEGYEELKAFLFTYLLLHE